MLAHLFLYDFSLDANKRFMGLEDSVFVVYSSHLDSPLYLFLIQWYMCGYDFELARDIMALTLVSLLRSSTVEEVSYGDGNKLNELPLLKPK